MKYYITTNDPSNILVLSYTKQNEPKGYIILMYMDSWGDLFLSLDEFSYAQPKEIPVKWLKLNGLPEYK